MKVALINPPLLKKTSGALGPIERNLFYNSAPLGLCYLASYLELKGHDVIVIDSAALGMARSDIIAKLKTFGPQIVGITVLTVSAYSSYAIARDIKKELPQARIIAGGPHITSSVYDLLSHPEIDIGVIGEGEYTLSEIVDRMEEGMDPLEIDGLAYVKAGALLRTRSRQFISDLDLLPPPARHLLPIDRYRPQPNDQRELPKLSMISSRGCPYQCIFCDKNVFKDDYRSFTPQYIVREMRQLVRDYKVKDIAFVDSTFTPNIPRVKSVVDEIRKASLNVTWTCSVRANVLNKEILKEMKDAGCWRVRIGVESGNDEILKFIKKGITKSQVRQVAKWAYELDLEPKGFFMIGHLTDTARTMEETIQFAKDLPLKDITVQVNTPLANTPQRELVDKYGTIIESDNLSNYSFFEPVFIPNGLTKKEILHYYRKFYIAFYLRPAVWLRHLKKIRRLTDITKYIEGVKILIFMLKSWIKERFS